MTTKQDRTAYFRQYNMSPAGRARNARWRTSRNGRRYQHAYYWIIVRPRLLKRRKEQACK